MCIFFKNKKIELVNSQDIMTTLVNKNIKLDTKISIPNNFIGLIYYGDKYLFSLPANEYKFQGDRFYKVIEKNARRNKKIKKPTYNFNLHYVNVSTQKIETTLNTATIFKEVETYTTCAVYKISNPQLFAKEILATWYKTTNKRTQKIIMQMFKDFSIKFLRRKLKKNSQLTEQLSDSANKYFKQYGIDICSIEIKNINLPQSNFFTQAEQDAPLMQKSFTPDNNIKNDSATYCPNCQSKIIEGADFCHKCGYRFTKNIRQ